MRVCCGSCHACSNSSFAFEKEGWVLIAISLGAGHDDTSPGERPCSEGWRGERHAKCPSWCWLTLPLSVGNSCQEHVEQRRATRRQGGQRAIDRRLECCGALHPLTGAAIGLGELDVVRRRREDVPEELPGPHGRSL